MVMMVFYSKGNWQLFEWQYYQGHTQDFLPGGQVYLYAEICTQMSMHSKSTEYILNSDSQDHKCHLAY
jgi:hypothetical protein